jgi:hypothetical protein
MIKPPDIAFRLMLRIDALFWPIRPRNRFDGQVIAQGRAALLAHHGVPWRVGGTAAERQRGGREIDAAEESDAIVVRRSGSTQAPVLALTEEAEAILRRRHCLAQQADALVLVDELADMGDTSRWWRETTVAGSMQGVSPGRPVKHPGRRLGWLGELAMLAGQRGLVETADDGNGAIWLRLTRRGDSLARQRATDGTAWLGSEKRRKPTKATLAAYWTGVDAELAAWLEQTPPEPREIGTTSSRPVAEMDDHPNEAAWLRSFGVTGD